MKPPAGLTLLVGGARSGKSALAVRLAEGFEGPVVFVATAVAGDEDMAQRIRRHQAERPASWSTLEKATIGAEDVAAIDGGACVVVDCLTLWLNEMMVASDDTAIISSGRELAAALAVRRPPTIVVTNEVGLGIVPANAVARSYRDTLGSVNREFGAVAAQSYFVSAGRLLQLSRPDDVFR